MTNSEGKSRPNEDMKQPQIVEATEVSDGTLESEAGAIEGKVSEIAKTSVSEDKQASGKKGDDSKPDEDARRDANAALKAKLLQKAPAEPKMRKQVKRALENKKYSLEKAVKRHKRKKNYHMLSVAIMQLRAVIHQLELLAKASYDQLKKLWLKFIHGLN